MENEIKNELADMISEIAKEVVTELTPKVNVEQKELPEQLSDYVKKEDVERIIKERIDSIKKTADTRNAMVEPTYHGAGNQTQKDYEAISKAKNMLGIDVETSEFKGRTFKLADSAVEIKTDREKSDTAVVKHMMAALMDGDRLTARKLEREFADPQALANKEKTLLAGSGSGSYTVPVGYEAVLVARRDEAFPIMDRLNRMTTNELTGYVPYEISLPAVYWETENVALRVSQPVWSTHLYTVKEQRATTVVSRKLEMSSNIDVMATIASEQGRALGLNLYQKMVTGTGATSLPMGLGYVSVPSGQSIVVAAGIGSGAGTLLVPSLAYSNLTSIAWALPKEYADDAVWMMHPDTQRRMYSARDLSGNYIFTNEMIVNGVRKTFMGAPIYPNSACGKVTDTKDDAINQMFYFVPKYYTIVTMKGITIDLWDQATIGGVNLAGQRGKAISTSNYLTMFSTSPYAFLRVSQIGLTKKPV